LSEGGLTAGQSAALRNLARKKAGNAVDWISIADARALTELGLAMRDRAGWVITAAGEALLAGQSEPPEEPGAQIIESGIVHSPPD
jgi:hypothetical protein